jgi:hypothetical protein
MSQTDPIAKATFLGFFMMARSPLTLNLRTISHNLSIPVDQLTLILNELEAEGRLQLTLTQAIARRVEPPELGPDDSVWEAEMQAKLDAEATEAKAVKGGRSHEPKP